MKDLVLGIGLWLILIIPPVRSFLESVMIVHMLIQLPLLILSGWLIGRFVVNRFHTFFRNWNENGIPGILIVVFITTYWMIPRALDEALTFPSIEILKFITLPIVGLFLVDSWKKIKTLGRTFVFLNYLSMFGLMGWLYIDSPIQICNNYLVAEQKMLGYGFLFITIMMLLGIIQYVFTDHSEA